MAFTIAIPFHRLDNFLLKAVESCLPDVRITDEILLINDSKIPNQEVSQWLGGFFHNNKVTLRVVSNDRGGIVNARNLALTKARFDYLSFLDSDDLWTPGRRDEHMRQLDNQESAPGVCSELEYSCAHGTRIGKSSLNHRFLRHTLKRYLIYFPRVRTSSTTIRVGKALESGGFLESESDCEDFGLWLRLQIDNGPFLIDKRVGAVYTIHKGQISNQIGDKAITTLLQLTVKAIENASNESSGNQTALATLLTSIQKKGIIYFALVGKRLQVKQALLDLRAPILCVLAWYLILTSRKISRRLCLECE